MFSPGNSNLPIRKALQKCKRQGSRERGKILLQGNVDLGVRKNQTTSVVCEVEIFSENNTHAHLHPKPSHHPQPKSINSTPGFKEDQATSATERVIGSEKEFISFCCFVFNVRGT